jgi:hypothetical protein
MKLTPQRFPFLDDYRLPHGYELKKRKRRLSEEQFKIVTLGDNISLGDNIFTSILSFGVDALLGLFSPNTPLTAAHVLKAYPGNGYWHDKMRAKILKHNSWVRDVTNPNPEHFNVLMQELVHENLFELSGGTFQNLSTEPERGVLGEYVKIFWNKIAQENQQSGNVIGYTGGINSDGTFSSFFSGGSDLQTIILIGAAIGLLFAMINKKKR